MLVAEATQLPRETLTARVDMARTRHRHAEPTLSAHRQPTLLVIGERPVGIALLIGEGDNMNRFFMAGPCMKVTASNGVDMRDSRRLSTNRKRTDDWTPPAGTAPATGFRVVTSALSACPAP